MSDETFTYEIEIKTTPERLWQAITDSEFTRRYWFGRRLSSSWQPGASVCLHLAGQGDEVIGEVLAVEPLKRLSFSWQELLEDPGREEPPSRVTITLTPRRSTVLLRIVHDQFKPHSHVRRSISAGWPAVCENLKRILEHA